MKKNQVELKAAMDFDKPVIMCCGSAKINPQTGCYEFVDDKFSLRNLEWMVDVEQAQASDPADRERIIGQINATCGAQALNDNVSASISGAYAAAAEARRYPQVATAIQAALCGEPEPLEEIPDEALATAVRVAASMNAVEPLRDFLKRRAPVDVPDSNGFTALMYAARAGCHRIIPILIGAGAGVDQFDPDDGSTALYLAADAGRTAAVQALLVAGANVNQPDNDGTTPLFVSALQGHSETIKLLLEAGADVNQANNNASTPISMAAMNGHVAIVKALLVAGANRNVTDKWGDTPESEARSNGHEEIVALLTQ
eukprot:SAG31_NODE_2809_length_5062_cov_2.636107_3_plen_314_part_00